MQSDTIIGIVGAVVLVAVMVGVFAYEYNNAPDDGGGGNGDEPTDAERMEQFNASAFGFLAAQEDIDGDGTPNYLDDDIDGDGTDNANDTEEVNVAFPVDGSAPANTNPGGEGAVDTTPFKVGSAAARLHVPLTYSTGQAGTFSIGCTVPGIDGAQASGDDEGSCEIEVSGGIAKGEYSLEVRQTQLNPQELAYSGEIHVIYAP